MKEKRNATLNKKRVAILTYERMSAFEFACPLEIFALPRVELGEGTEQAYDCEVLAIDTKRVTSTGGIQIKVANTIGNLAGFGTIVVPSWPTQSRNIPEGLKQGIDTCLQRGGRIVSICSGAFLLAELGLLDGKHATTHWQYSDIFQRRFPKVSFQRDVLYTEDDNIFTSAGSSAGLDLCLHLVRQDFGYGKANIVARRLVMSPQRSGGQAQFIEHIMPKHRHQLSEALAWAIEHLSEQWTVDDWAAQACLSRRSFDRQFRATLATSPKQWLIEQRVALACTLLESSTASIEHVAEGSGFEKAINLRHHFKGLKSISPVQYRTQFGKNKLKMA